MEIQDIIYGNKKVAKFMALTGNQTGHSEQTYFTAIVKYHSDWMWLHRAIDKIMDDVHGKKTEGLDYDLMNEELGLFHLHIYADKETVFQEVVKAVLWYEEHTPVTA